MDTMGKSIAGNIKPPRLKSKIPDFQLFVNQLDRLDLIVNFVCFNRRLNYEIFKLLLRIIIFFVFWFWVRRDGACDAPTIVSCQL